MDPQAYTVIGTLSGAIVGGGVSIWLSTIARKNEQAKIEAEDRRHFKDLAFKAAVEEWTWVNAFAERQSKPMSLAPLQVYFLSWLKWAELAELDNPSVEQLTEGIKKANTYSDTVLDELSRMQKE